MKGNTISADWLKLLFRATAIANIADNAASSPLTSLYFSLHTADPGAGGNQTTNEAAYTSYARAAVTRDSSGFGITSQTISPVANVAFPAATGGTEVETHWSVGTASSGTGKILYSGPIGTKQGGFTAAASGDTITAPGVSGVSVGDQLSFYAVAGGTLPAGITGGTIYYCKTITGSAITISATNGGSTLDITADGAGYMFRHGPISVSSGVTPALTTGTTITEY